MEEKIKEGLKNALLARIKPFNRRNQKKYLLDCIERFHLSKRPSQPSFRPSPTPLPVVAPRPTPNPFLCEYCSSSDLVVTDQGLTCRECALMQSRPFIGGAGYQQQGSVGGSSNVGGTYTLSSIIAGNIGTTPKGKAVEKAFGQLNTFFEDAPKTAFVKNRASYYFNKYLEKLVERDGEKKIPGQKGLKEIVLFSILFALRDANISQTEEVLFNYFNLEGDPRSSVWKTRQKMVRLLQQNPLEEYTIRTFCEFQQILTQKERKNFDLYRDSLIDAGLMGRQLTSLDVAVLLSVLLAKQRTKKEGRLLQIQVSKACKVSPPVLRKALNIALRHLNYLFTDHF